MSTTGRFGDRRKRGARAVKTGLMLTLRNELSEIRRLAAALESFSEAEGIPQGAAMRMTLVLDELLTNTISYGYPNSQPGEIQVAATRHPDRVEIAVSDDARPFDPRKAEAPDLEAGIEEREIGGLGIHLINTMAEVGYTRDGDRNVVTLSVPLPQDGTAGDGRPAAVKTRR